MISDFVSFVDHPPGNLRKEFDLTAQHEKCRSQVMSREHIKYALGICGRPVVKRERYG
jgi:hypothetical protein